MSFLNSISSTNNLAMDAAHRVSRDVPVPQFALNESGPDSIASKDVAQPGLGAKPPEPEGEELRKAFQDFVGQTLFSQMISSMRETTKGAVYFNGGQAEKIFQGQLDQMLSQQLSEASASSISDPMFKLFQLRRGA